MSLEDAQAVFRRQYAIDVTEYCQRAPNFEYWFASGPYRGEDDVNRRFDIGMDQVAKYVRYYTETAPDEVPWVTPEGKLAIELECTVDLDGVEVTGKIDGVMMVRPEVPRPRTASGKLSTSKKALAEYEAAREAAVPRPRIRDGKTGQLPGDDFQLGTYDVLVLAEYGLKADQGDYWMAKPGKPTEVYDLTEWTREAVTAEFHWLDEQIRAENWEPKPDPDKCSRCSVQTACVFRA